MLHFRARGDGLSGDDFPVNRGDVVIRLDDTRARSEAEALRVQYITASALLARLQAERDGAELACIKLLAEKLPSNCFMRVHRSYMVNLKEIREVANDKLVLDGGAVIPVSDSYRRDLKDFTRKASTPW